MEEVTQKLHFKKENKPKQKGTDFGLKILAVVLAVIVWFILSITQYPIISKTITNVQVTFSTVGTKAEEKGLSPINYKQISVDVEIKGMNYEIGNYTSDDLIATVNLDKVTQEGRYDLEIDVKSTHSADKCTIVSVSPSTVTVDFDRMTSKTVEVIPEAPMIRAEEGYTLRDKGTTVSPSEITVSGAKNDVENIDKAVAKITKSKVLKADTTINTSDIIFYDADDNVLDSSKFEIEGEKNFSVNFQVYKKKTANLKLNITGCPDNFDVSSLPISMSEEQISVISPNLADENTETIEVGTLPLSSISPDKEFTYQIKLNSGEINMNGIETVKVTFNKEGYTSKKFTISADHIKTVNKSSKSNARIETKKLTNVEIYGPTEIINKLTNNDIYAQVDLSDVYDTGSYTRNALVYVPDYDNVWCYGTNEVQVVVE